MSYILDTREELKNYIEVEKFGQLPDIDAAETNQDVWDGTGIYAGWLSANTAMTVSSDDANDTLLGTGARTIRVFGLTQDSNGNWVTSNETVNMDGQNGVALSVDRIRVYRVFVVESGGGETNAGNIYIGSGAIVAGVPANIYAQIRLGFGQTLMAIYTTADTDSSVTLGNAKIIRWYATCGPNIAATAVMALQTRTNGESWRTRRVRNVANTSFLDERLTFGITVPPKTDIRIRVLSNAVVNTSVEAGFDLAQT